MRHLRLPQAGLRSFALTSTHPFVAPCASYFDITNTTLVSKHFSTSHQERAPRDPSRFDSAGRTPGFARRRRHDHPEHNKASEQPPQPPDAQNPHAGKNEQISRALGEGADGNAQSLLAPVHIPDDAHAILKPDHPSTNILANSSIVVQRQLEMMNVFMGFEQANKYIIMDPSGNHIGYMAEQDHGLGNMFARQMFRTHRSFTTHVFDRNEMEVLRFHRPFSWISSRIRVYDAASADMSNYGASTALQGTSLGSINSQTSAQVSPLNLRDMRVIGEAQQEWAPLRRKYNLFLHRELSQQPSNPETPRLTSGNLPLSESKALTVVDNDGDNRQMGFAQFASVNEPFLSWDFSLLSADNQLIGSVNRNFAGWGRELFTDTGVYALRMEAAGLETSQQSESSDQPISPSLGMTLDQRAIILATAVSIDFDYFSRHSSAAHGGGGFMPLWFPFPMGGGGAAAGAEGAGAAGAGAGAGAGAAGAGAAEAGALETSAGGAVAGAQNAARGVGVGEGAVTGAATMAGYEAMQRGREANVDNQSPQQPPQDMADNEQWDPWGRSQDDNDPWGKGGGDAGGGGGGGGSEGGGGGGGMDIDDFF